MRIVDRATFLTLPAGTIFMKFPAQPKDSSYLDFGYDRVVAIKEDTCFEDFAVQDLVPWFYGCNDSNDFDEVLEAMLNGQPSPPVDYDFAGRDGLFDREQLFLVWEKDDAEKLLDRLRQAFEAGYQGGT